MTPESLRRIREIYEKALSITGSDREEYLNRECMESEQIRKEVERLLRGHDNSPDWLDRPALGTAKAFTDLGLPKMEGRRLGGYEVIRELGRGGAGIVYLAERSDETFHRQAAIKLVLPPANSDDVIARFQREREILASLDHPNIAKLLDAGVTEEGWPFFVMEFVDGQPIHRWCDERKLTVSQRLQLFREVIDAVRFAHQHLVVHRDLKPSNILVNKGGSVKLLDFGIAKVLPTIDPGAAPETITLARMMTPEYASPEQVNGTAITTLSDIYSLGVVLYELLTGHRPYRLFSAGVHEMFRVISEVEPARPSEVVTTSEPAYSRDRTQITPETVSAVREGDPGRLRKRLAGDLDSILLMALRKEPERRYASAESFAEDLLRHLEQRPVNARESSPWENFQRYRRRNPGTFLGAGLVVTLFLAGLAAVAIQARHDILAAQLNRGFLPFIAPLWIFTAGFTVAALGVTIYFSRPNRGLRLAAAAGGLVWGFGLTGRMMVESHLGIWRSGVEGSEDPLMLMSPWTLLIFPVIGATLLLIFQMIGRRFGWKGQILALTVLGLYQAVRERIWFGEFIPALTFKPGVLPILGSAGMIISAGLLALLVTRLLDARDTAASSARK